MALVRDRFKELIQKEHFIFSGSFDAEDSFLYVYHYRELQEIRRVANYLLETNQEKLYKKFIMEFFNDLSPSGLQELKVHQINNESDKKFSLTGLCIRLTDKISRLKNLLSNGKNYVKGESMEDTFIDIANYGIIGLLVGRDKWKK